MDQLHIEEEVRELLERCVVEGNPTFTRDRITSLFNQNNTQTLEITVALMKELTVFVLHQSFNPLLKKENNSCVNEFKQNSRIGTVPLPDASEFADLESKSCGSDVPSHSSASSAVENQKDDLLTEEVWKQTLGTQHMENGDNSLVHKPNYHTHKDFFESLIKDLDTDKTWADVMDSGKLHNTLAEMKKESESSNNSSYDDLSLEDKIFTAASSSLAIMEGLVEEKYNITDGLITKEYIIELSKTVTQQFTFHSREGEKCIDDFNRLLTPFIGKQYNNFEVRSEILNVLQRNLLAHSNKLGNGQWMCNSEIDEFDTMELLDDMYDDSAMSNSEVSSTINPSGQHSVPLTAQAILNQNMQHVKKLLSSAKEGEPIPTDIKIQEMKLPKEIFLNDSEFSSESESIDKMIPLAGSNKDHGHSPKNNHTTPAKSPALQSLATPNSLLKRQKINYDSLDPTLPAWEIPKSPLDGLFRCGYGGLGQSKLEEVIDLVEEDDNDDGEFDSENIQAADLLSSKKLSELNSDTNSTKSVCIEDYPDSEDDDEFENLENVKSFERLKSSQSLNSPQKVLSHLPLVSQNPRISKYIISDEQEKKAAKVARDNQRPQEKITDRKPLKKAKKRVKRAVKKTSHPDVVESVSSSDFLESNRVPEPKEHPSVGAQSLANGPHFTKNPSLNEMIYNSYREYLMQYAKSNIEDVNKKDDYHQKISSLRSNLSTLQASVEKPQKKIQKPVPPTTTTTLQRKKEVNPEPKKDPKESRSSGVPTKKNVTKKATLKKAIK